MCSTIRLTQFREACAEIYEDDGARGMVIPVDVPFPGVGTSNDWLHEREWRWWPKRLFLHLLIPNMVEG
jgi:hypothetical protein